MGRLMKIDLVRYEGEAHPVAVLTVEAEGRRFEIEQSELELIALIELASAVKRGMEWARAEYGITTGIDIDHIFHKGERKSLCGISNDDGKPLQGHPYFGETTACLCKRCERSYQRRQG